MSYAICEQQRRTVYVRRKQLRIIARVCAALLLFFPMQSNKSPEKHYAAKKATPRSTREEGKGCLSSFYFFTPNARQLLAGSSKSMTMKRMRTNQRIYVFCLRSLCRRSRYSCNAAKYSTTQHLRSGNATAAQGA